MIKHLKQNRLQKYKRRPVVVVGVGLLLLELLRCPVVVVGARLPCVEFKNNKWNNRIISFAKNNSRKQGES